MSEWNKGQWILIMICDTNSYIYVNVLMWLSEFGPYTNIRRQSVVVRGPDVRNVMKANKGGKMAEKRWRRIRGKKDTENAKHVNMVGPLDTRIYCVSYTKYVFNNVSLTGRIQSLVRKDFWFCECSPNGMRSIKGWLSDVTDCRSNCVVRSIEWRLTVGIYTIRCLFVVAENAKEAARVDHHRLTVVVDDCDLISRWRSVRGQSLRRPPVDHRRLTAMVDKELDVERIPLLCSRCLFVFNVLYNMFCHQLGTCTLSARLER